MNFFETLFQVIADIVERHPIITPIATLLGIICIVVSATLENSEIGMVGLAIFFGINLGILFYLIKYSEISGGEFFTFLFTFILTITFGTLLLQRLQLDPKVEPIVTASLGASVAPILISIRVINQIRKEDLK